MATLNYLMYIPETEPVAELVPYWTQTGDFADRHVLGHDILAYPDDVANANCNDPYYLRTDGIRQNGNLVIYIPYVWGKRITTFYLLSNRQWSVFQEGEHQYFTHDDTFVDQSTSIRYDTYTFYDFDALGRPQTGEIVLSFDLEDNTFATPDASVQEFND